MRWTEDQLRAYEMRNAPIVRQAMPDDAVSLESPLQEKIEEECRRRRWPFVRSRMDKATVFTFPGVPDFVIAADGGRVLWIECKSKTGKQTTDQIGFQMMLNRCGHLYYLIRSFQEFLGILNFSSPTPTDPAPASEAR